jgi:hypothetical protein
MMTRVWIVLFVTVAVLRIAAPAPAAGQQCCACDLTAVPGFGDIECGSPDANCVDCIGLGGHPAASCSICDSVPSCIGNTDCGGGPSPQNLCCACDFGNGNVECGTGDVNCAECITLGGQPAASCSVCGGNPECVGHTLCEAPKPAPVASTAGVVALAVLLAAVGTVSLKARSWRRS